MINASTYSVFFHFTIIREKTHTLTMFFNRKRVEENTRLLDRLQETVKESHKVTLDRVTKDFKTPQRFSRAQYITAKFKEA